MNADRTAPNRTKLAGLGQPVQLGSVRLISHVNEKAEPYRDGHAQ